MLILGPLATRPFRISLPSRHLLSKPWSWLVLLCDKTCHLVPKRESYHYGTSQQLDCQTTRQQSVSQGLHRSQFNKETVKNLHILLNYAVVGC